ncbi:hypothetical protein LINPERHAP2_LOCUS19771 [Linum perenne]
MWNRALVFRLLWDIFASKGQSGLLGFVVTGSREEIYPLSPLAHDRGSGGGC